MAALNTAHTKGQLVGNQNASIEAALELTSDNRASAAEMLGLSRQSLYVKLRRYGLGDIQGSSAGAGA